MGSNSDQKAEAKYNALADAMSEYHRDQAQKHREANSSVGFGNWEGNKQRKKYYRNQAKALEHDKEKSNWSDSRN